MHKLNPFGRMKFTGIIGIVILCIGITGCYFSSNDSDFEERDRWYIREENNYSDAEWQECLDTLADLSSLGITRPGRFKTLQDAMYIVEQRNNLENKIIAAARPVTIVMHPFFDYNNVFSGKKTDLSTIINRLDQQVLFFQIGNDADLIAALTLL